MKAKVRKLLTFVEETRSEMGQAVEPPTGPPQWRCRKLIFAAAAMSKISPS